MAPRKKTGATRRKRAEDHPDLVEQTVEPDGSITVDGGMEAEREHLERFFGKGKAKKPAAKRGAR